MRILTMLAVAMMSVSSACGDEAMRLPFEEKLREEKLTGGWTTVTPDGSVARVANGWLSFESPDGGYSHIERPLGVDSVTVTASVISLASIYLVWGPGEWCAVGKISPTPFARFATTVVTGGAASQEGHRACFAHSPHYLRIQLGTDVVRMFYSNDGQKWGILRVVERPAGFSGPPSLVAFGANYTAAQNPFSAQRARPSGTKAAPRGSVRDITIQETPANARTITAAEERSLGEPKIDPVTRAHAAFRADPTFRSVSPHYPPFLYPREVVGVPEHPLDIGVDYLGRLDVSPWTAPTAWLLIGDESQPLGRQGVPFKRRLLDGCIPVVTLSVQRDGVAYAMTVFGWSEGLSTEKDLYAYVRLECSGRGTAALPSRLALGYGDGGKMVHLKLRPSGSRAMAVFKFRHPEPATAVDIDRGEFDARLNEVAAGWRERLAHAERFGIPDKRVQDAYRAWVAYSMLNADRIEGRTEVHDGAGFYDIMFGYSVSLYAIAADLYGLHDYAERVLDAQLHFQRDDGLYLQECGLPDHGSLLIALSEHFRVTSDRAWLARVAPAMAKACEWIVRQRAQAPADGLLKGLIKFRPYNDYPEPVYNYTGNTIACEGLRLAAECLSSFGSPDAARYAAEAVRFHRDILDSMKKAAFRRDGMMILPIEPDTHRLLKLSDYQGGAYYGLVASQMMEQDFFAVADPPVQMLVDALEKRGGLIAGLCDFMEGIDHAYTYGYLMTQMKRGEIRKVLLGFWGMLAFGMTRETYSPVEVHMIATGENHLTLPHTYSCTQQLRLLRNMLVREEGADLRLLDAVPEAWLRPGKAITADAAPTRFGPVSFRVSGEPDGAVRVRVTPPDRKVPANIRIRLRVPGGAPISRVEGGPRGVTFAGNILTIAAPAGPVDLRVLLR